LKGVSRPSASEKSATYTARPEGCERKNSSRVVQHVRDQGAVRLRGNKGGAKKKKSPIKNKLGGQSRKIGSKGEPIPGLPHRENGTPALCS